MKATTFVLALFSTFIASASASAVDLTKIERRIAKEPAYKKTPKYCLLAFGPEAKFRVWIVMDGDTLYVDRNGNGDLTEKGERFKPQAPAEDKKYLTWEIGDIVDLDGKTKHRELKVTHSAPDWFHISVNAGFANPKVARLHGYAIPCFAKVPADALIVHFGAPLTMRLSFATCGGIRSDICARVGTPGVGKRSFVDYSWSVLPLVRKAPKVMVMYFDPKRGIVRETAKLNWNG